jgi:sorting nexin-1/2
MESTNLDDDEDDEDGSRKPRQPPPVQPHFTEHPQRQTQPSVSLVEAAKPTFNITVGDPHKVGDLTSAHTEYQVYTKVGEHHGSPIAQIMLMCYS